MSVENKNVIDYVSLDKYGNAVLTISDHLEWHSDNEHLLILQDKINAYLSAIEGGELYKRYPQAQGRKVIISVMAQHHPNKDGQIFLDRIKQAIEAAGYKFYFQLPNK